MPQEKALGPTPQPSIVRVAIPAKVAYNLKSMQKVTAEILDRLGCPACHSGHDIRFELIRDFLVDEELRVTPIAPELGIMR